MVTHGRRVEPEVFEDLDTVAMSAGLVVPHPRPLEFAPTPDRKAARAALHAAGIEATAAGYREGTGLRLRVLVTLERLGATATTRAAVAAWLAKVEAHVLEGDIVAVVPPEPDARATAPLGRRPSLCRRAAVGALINGRSCYVVDLGEPGTPR